MSVAPPNYTQVPNIVLDRMTDFTPSEFKLAMFICRQTFGFHRERHFMSYSYIEEKTGICRESISKAIAGLHAKDFISRQIDGTSFSYSINMDGISSENGLVRITDQTSSETELLPVRKPNTLKEITKENIKETSASSTWEIQFESFWKAYPNKAGKPKAKQSFFKALKSFTFEQIMEGLNRHIKCHDWTKDNGQYVPHPTTYLNQERFNDIPKASPLFAQKQFTPTNNPNQNI